MTRQLTTLLLVLTPALAQAIEVPRDYTANLEAGLKLHLQGKYADAIPYFARARRVYDKDWRAHTLQALALIELARVEKDAARKNALYLEARAMQGPLTKKAGMRFDDPLRHYLNGLEAAGRGDMPRAYALFQKAEKCRPEQFRRYEPIRLAANVQLSYGLVHLDKGTHELMRGMFEEANATLEQAAKLLPERDERQLYLHANIAVAKENIGQIQGAVEHLRRAEGIAKDRGLKEHAQDVVSAIALLWVNHKEPEKAAKVLAELPADSRLPKVIEARCGLRRLEAQRNPELLIPTLAYYREQMKHYPRSDLQRLVVPYAELIATNISRSQAEENRALLEATVEMVEKERRLHPECPAAYWLLSRIHALLGDEKRADEFKRLHQKKKEEYEKGDQFNKDGRGRCAGAG
ncbi:MAG: tetratricopeptide repeat protein [Planctomycetota bacterium]